VQAGGPLGVPVPGVVGQEGGVRRVQDAHSTNATALHPTVPRCRPPRFPVGGSATVPRWRLRRPILEAVAQGAAHPFPPTG
jgi:hypothetical protein